MSEGLLDPGGDMSLWLPRYVLVVLLELRLVGDSVGEEGSKLHFFMECGKGALYTSTWSSSSRLVTLQAEAAIFLSRKIVRGEKCFWLEYPKALTNHDFTDLT